MHPTIATLASIATFWLMHVLVGNCESTLAMHLVIASYLLLLHMLVDASNKKAVILYVNKH